MYNKNIQNARNLRKNMTPHEYKNWQIIKDNQINNCRFRRQVPIGHYIVDFMCRKKMLIIEIDGGQHNTTEEIEYDKNRTIYLTSLGYKVIRFWNNDIDNNIEGVYQEIFKYLS